VKFPRDANTNKGGESGEEKVEGVGGCSALEAGAIIPSCVISRVALCAKKYANKIVNGAKHLPRPFQLLPLPGGGPFCSSSSPNITSLSQPKILDVHVAPP